MKLFFIVLIFLSSIVLANEPDITTPTLSEINAELSSRTGLAESTLSELLSNCDANQQSVNICAQRDFVAADLFLITVEKEKLEQFPECAAIIKKRIDRFEKNRSKCSTSSNKTYGDASMQALAQTQCFTMETKKMSQQLTCFQVCKRHK